MTKKRPGYRNVTTQLTEDAWSAIYAEAESREVSIAKILNEILHKHYKIAMNKIPAPKRAGRKPKK